MKTVHLICILAFHTYFTFAALTYKLERASKPTPDQSAAYAAIENAMSAAVNRYNRFVVVDMFLKVQYVSIPQTLDAYNQTNIIQFGTNKNLWTEHVALHTISHRLGVGGPAFIANCQRKAWPLATIEVRKLFNNPKLEIGCDKRHFWPGGLNWSKEFSPINADHHCKIIQAMRKDGMN
ncbi:secreted protein [Melampsora americana]|nr:secreted protein [Melampsora americana]